MTTATQKLTTQSGRSAEGLQVASALDATTLCTDLGRFVGRSLVLALVTTDLAVDAGTMVRVTVRVTDADGGTVDLDGVGTGADVALATNAAVLDAIARADASAIPLWDLHRRGHISAAVTADADGPRCQVGTDEDIRRLRQLCDAVPSGSSVSARTATALYRAAHNGIDRLAVRLADEPAAIDLVEGHLAALNPARTRSPK